MSNQSTTAVATTPVLICNLASPAMIYNQGAGPLYLGDNFATLTATGVPILSGNGALWPANVPCYGISSSACNATALPNVIGLTL